MGVLETKRAAGLERLNLDRAVERDRSLPPQPGSQSSNGGFGCCFCPKLEEWGQDSEIREPAGNFSKLQKGL